LTDLELETGEIERRRRDGETRDSRRQHRVRQARFTHQHIVGRAAAVTAIDSETRGGVALRIEINDEHLLADRRKRGAEVDRGCRLADTAFLVGDCNYARGRGTGNAAREGDDLR